MQISSEKFVNKLNEYVEVYYTSKKLSEDTSEIESTISNYLKYNIFKFKLLENTDVFENLLEINPKLGYKFLKCFEHNDKRNELLKRVGAALEERGFFSKAKKAREECEGSYYTNKRIEEGEKEYFSGEIDGLNLDDDFLLKNSVPVSFLREDHIEKTYLTIYDKLIVYMSDSYPEACQELQLKFDAIDPRELNNLITETIVDLLIKLEMYNKIEEFEKLMRTLNGRERIVSMLDRLNQMHRNAGNVEKEKEKGKEKESSAEVQRENIRSFHQRYFPELPSEEFQGQDLKLTFLDKVKEELRTEEGIKQVFQYCILDKIKLSALFDFAKNTRQMNILILLQAELSEHNRHKVDLSDFWDLLESSGLQKAYENAIDL